METLADFFEIVALDKRPELFAVAVPGDFSPFASILPSELQALIFEFMCQDLKCICQLALVSKQFLEIAQRGLYYEINLGGNHQEALHDTRLGLRRVTLLIRTLVDRPELARRIARLSIYDCFDDNSEPISLAFRQWRGAAESLPILPSAKSRVGHWMARVYYPQVLRERNFGALVALLLCQLKGLESLQIFAIDVQMAANEDLLQFLSHIFTEEPQCGAELFPKLKHVHFPEKGFSLGAWEVFHIGQLSTVRSLSVRLPRSRPLQAEGRRALHLQNLEVMVPGRREKVVQHLESILAWTPCLARLRVRFAIKALSSSGANIWGRSVLDLQRLGTVLRGLSRLASLGITYREFGVGLGPDPVPHVTDVMPLGSLRSLSRLRDICLPWWTLRADMCGPAELLELLPPSTDQILLTGDLKVYLDFGWSRKRRKRFIDELNSLLESKKSHFAFWLPNYQTAWEGHNWWTHDNEEIEPAFVASTALAIHRASFSPRL